MKHNGQIIHRCNLLSWKRRNPTANSPWSWTTNDLKPLQIWVWSSDDSSKRGKINGVVRMKALTQHWSAWCYCHLFLPSPAVSRSCRWTDSWSAAAWHWQLPVDRAAARRVEGGPRNGYCSTTRHHYSNELTQLLHYVTQMYCKEVHSSTTKRLIMQRCSFTDTCNLNCAPR